MDTLPIVDSLPFFKTFVGKVHLGKSSFNSFVEDWGTVLMSSFRIIVEPPIRTNHHIGSFHGLIAAGLVYDAVKNGYKAYMITMQNLISLIKMKDISTAALRTYKKLLRADLVAIDDIMLLPVKREEAAVFLISLIYFIRIHL